VRRKVPTPSELAGIARHLGLDDAERDLWKGKPLNELYTNLVCGSVRLNLRNVKRAEAVPLAHQSALAGILMAAELVKRTSPTLRERSQRQPVVQLIDVRLPPPAAGRWAQDRAHHPRCICQDPVYQQVFARKWRGESTKPE